MPRSKSLASYLSSLPGELKTVQLPRVPLRLRPRGDGVETGLTDSRPGAGKGERSARDSSGRRAGLRLEGRHGNPGSPEAAHAGAPCIGQACGLAEGCRQDEEEVEKAWQDVLAFASQIGDREVKVALAQALKGCDAKRKSAVAAADPARQDALLKAVLEDIKSARESARKRSEEIPRQLAPQASPGSGEALPGKLRPVREAHGPSSPRASAPRRSRRGPQRPRSKPRSRSSRSR